MRIGRTEFGTRLVPGLILVIFTATGALAEQVRISFRDLPDPAAQDFSDPFRDMGLEQLEELRTVVRLGQRLESGEVAVEVRPRLEARLESARETLARNGHDVEALLAQRWVVAKARKRALLATNPGLDQVAIEITGFLIPAGSDANGARVGYLVPQVGMCSHTPPPPPNQLIRVKLDAASPAQTLYTPVTVSGALRAEESDNKIFVLDGEVRMLSMWDLDATAVTLAERSHSVSSINPWQEMMRSAGERTLGNQQPRFDQ